MNKPVLANHQIKGVDHVTNTFLSTERVAERKRTLMVAPTGAGKTVLFGSISDVYANNGKYVFILTDRQNLLKQTGKSLSNFFGNPISYIKAGQKGMPDIITLEGKRIYIFVGMVESLMNRIKDRMFLRFIKNSSLFIIDEAHEKRFSKVINNEDFKDIDVLGVTATPVYSSTKRRMSEDYDEIQVLSNEIELIEDGYLLKPKTISFDLGSSAKLKKRNGEYTDDSQISKQKYEMPFDRMIFIYLEQCDKFKKHLEQSNYKLFISEYSHKKHLKALYFGVNSSHVIEITKAFNDYGISAKYILSDTKIQSAKERESVENSFANNEFSVLVNCQITTKGYDSPDVIIIGKMYLTASIAKDNQVGGRGSRPQVEGLHKIPTPMERKEAIANSKKPHFIIIDYLGNWQEHGEWHDTKDWKGIFHKKPKEYADQEAPEKQCPKCKNMVFASLMYCNAKILNPESDELEICGHEFEARSAKEIRHEFKEINQEEILFKDKKPDQIKMYTIAEISSAYTNKYIDFKTAITAVRKKGDFNLLEFGETQGYKDIEKWLSKRFYINEGRFLELKKERETYLKECFWREMKEHFGGLPFEDAMKAKVISEINSKKTLGLEWVTIENEIREKHKIGL